MKITSMQVGPICTNCYLVQDEQAKACAIVDPGDSGERIAEAVKATGCQPVCVLLTHGHTDHTDGLAGLLKCLPGLPVYIHAADPVGTSELFGPLPADADIHHYDEGDTVAVGGLTVHVLHTPGHSQGSVTLQVENALLCGDTLFAGSCGRVDLPGGDMGQILHSLARLARLEGDYAVYPGHMESSTLAQERQTNPYVLHALRTEP